MDPPYDINLVFVLKITIVLRKIKKNLPPELHFLTLVGAYAPSRFSARASSQTPLGKLTALPQPPQLYLERTSKGKGGGVRPLP